MIESAMKLKSDKIDRWLAKHRIGEREEVADSQIREE
jgi:hypothetical protein